MIRWDAWSVGLTNRSASAILEADDEQNEPHTKASTLSGITAEAAEHQ